MSKKWIAIVNPNAGSHKGGKDWNKINSLLISYKIDFEFIFTKKAKDAFEFTQQYINKGFRNFIAIGGDGTFNEIVNGIFNQNKIPTNEFIIATIPVGTGNDWCRMHNIPFDYKKAIEILKNENVFLHDVGKVSYFVSEISKFHFFINVTGLGYDALVAMKTNEQKARGKGGNFSYFFNIFSILFRYKERKIKVFSGNDEYKVDLFSMNVGICKYNGGGMMQLPGAIADDGLLDVTIIKKVGKWDFLTSLKKLYDGKINQHPKVIAFQTQSLYVETDNKVFLEADGESLGNGPFDFSIIPLSVNVIVGHK